MDSGQTQISDTHSKNMTNQTAKLLKSRICKWNNNYSEQYPLVLAHIGGWKTWNERKSSFLLVYDCLQTQEKPGFWPAFLLLITELKLWIGKEGLHQWLTQKNTPSTFATQRSLAFSLINFGIKTSVSTCLRWISSKGERKIQRQTIRTMASINIIPCFVIITMQEYSRVYLLKYLYCSDSEGFFSLH